ncbi:hypothetical protein NDU88_004794 [Pleurodeles waltl]|uniref:Uncharacterized protein n=1 Tax=Pleurodeles waltl TaxID=8319 RepID=A0AAV7QIV8_PLEWA|nr:hypothetical protein NDU88_004794 [Pleurodeles waltl]
MIVSGQVAPLRRLGPLLQLTRGALMVKVQLRLLRIMFTHGEERPTGSRREPPAKAPSLLHTRVAAPAQAPQSAHAPGSSHGSPPNELQQAFPPGPPTGCAGPELLQGDGRREYRTSAYASPPPVRFLPVLAAQAHPGVKDNFRISVRPAELTQRAAISLLSRPRPPSFLLPLAVSYCMISCSVLHSGAVPLS